MAEFVMPSLGADMTAGTLAKWRVVTGDTVSHGDIIAEVETHAREEQTSTGSGEKRRENGE